MMHARALVAYPQIAETAGRDDHADRFD